MKVKIILIFVFIFTGFLFGQRIPDPNKGDPTLTQWGIMDGNNVRTLYSNHGEVARWPDQPSGEWPKGSGHSYVDGVALIIAASTNDTSGNRIHPMSTNYREDIDNDPVTKVPWGWAPLPGYSNVRSFYPARSDDESTWPDYWPDKMNTPEDPGWAGNWNGFFGKGIKNADVETYFICDDSPDEEWLNAREDGSGVFYPDMNDATRGGLGMEVAVRGFQWSHVLAQDVIFWYYEITNEGTIDYDSVYFSQRIDWGIGGTGDSGDDEGGYNTYFDIAVAWDFDKRGAPGYWTPVGTAAYAFLESPGNSSDNFDNDTDGIIDENRNSDIGILIESQEEILEYVQSYYNLADFENYYGSLEKRYPYLKSYWWTGDEDVDWRSFEDLNLNGVWDVGEPLNDDVGEDGLAPYHPNYISPDFGEGNGQPDQGEPNFGQTDKDESDQIGLTGFKVFDLHDYELIEDEENWRELFTKLQSPKDAYLEGGRNLGMFFSSGPFPMEAGQTERFSMALLFANKDFPDAPSDDEFRNSSLARKKLIVQQIYNADYRFATPPDKPILHAFSGDGKVILYWNKKAEDSYDPFLQEYDFEGYKLYRSTEPFFTENMTITNAYGEKMFKKSIYQCDKINEHSGLHPVSIEGAQFYLGSNSGLRHFYVDNEVINGVTYYYALVSYDYGNIAVDADSNILVDEHGHTRGISPSECTANIKMDISGNIQVDVNTKVAIPRSTVLGFKSPEFLDFTHYGPGTGHINLEVLDEDSLLDDHKYRLTFIGNSSHYNQAVPLYVIKDLTSGNIVADSTPVAFNNQEISIFNGVSGTISNDFPVNLVCDSTGWVEGSNCNYIVEIRKVHEDKDLEWPWAPQSMPYPADFLINFEDTPVDISMQLGWTRPPTAVPFRIYNISEDRYAIIGIAENSDPPLAQAYDQLWQVDEPIFIITGDSAWTEPTKLNYKIAWSIRLFPPEDPDITPVPPQPGDMIYIKTTKPFRNGEYYEFTVKAPRIDEEAAKNDLDKVYVVPNPYVATSIFEPTNPYKTGRERRIYFMKLPSECDISIYTKSGYLVNRIHHQGNSLGDGMEAWDLVSRDGMDIAYGIYFYVVEYKGQKKAGRFAVIK